MSIHGETPIPIITTTPMDNDYIPGPDCTQSDCPGYIPPGAAVVGTATPATSTGPASCPVHVEYTTTIAVILGMLVGAGLTWASTRLLMRRS